MERSHRGAIPLELEEVGLVGVGGIVRVLHYLLFFSAHNLHSPHTHAHTHTHMSMHYTRRFKWNHSKRQHERWCSASTSNA